MGLSLDWMLPATDVPTAWWSYTNRQWHELAAAFAILVLLAEVLAWLVMQFERIHPNMLVVGGKPLVTLTRKDIAFICFNKATSPFFVYHICVYVWYYGGENIEWSPNSITATNFLLPIVPLFVIYDLFYSQFHYLLHWRAIYGLVHKHHHTQKAPIRGNYDAVNVHPFEFVVGEWLHLVSIIILTSPWLLNFKMHVGAAALFVVIGGILASLNHTRFDLGWGPVYQVNYHDLHHRVPDVNMGQYTMLWDRVFGTYRAYTAPRPYKGK